MLFKDRCLDGMGGFSGWNYDEYLLPVPFDMNRYDYLSK